MEPQLGAPTAPQNVSVTAGEIHDFLGGFELDDGHIQQYGPRALETVGRVLGDMVNNRPGPEQIVTWYPDAPGGGTIIVFRPGLALVDNNPPEQILSAAVGAAPGIVEIVTAGAASAGSIVSGGLGVLVAVYLLGRRMNRELFGAERAVVLATQNAGYRTAVFGVADIQAALTTQAWTAPARYDEAAIADACESLTRLGVFALEGTAQWRWADDFEVRQRRADGG